MTETYKCYKCGVADVREEFQRCEPCNQTHAELVAKLDAVKRVKVPKIKEELMALKEMKQGIEVTTWIDRETARWNGIEFKPTPY